MFIAIGLTGAAGAWAFVALLRQLYYICLLYTSDAADDP